MMTEVKGCTDVHTLLAIVEITLGLLSSQHCQQVRYHAALLGFLVCSVLVLTLSVSAQRRHTGLCLSNALPRVSACEEIYCRQPICSFVGGT